MNRFIALLCAWVCWAHLCTGQDFQFKAAIDPVPEDHFYKILLSPQITGRLTDDFSDLRLYDRDGHEVPYIVKREQPVQYTTLFKEYEWIKKPVSQKGITSLVLRNASRSKINNISLLIKNANVRKKANLSGSNDARHWYIIEDDYVLQSIANNSETAEVKMLDFPLSDYEFYKLEIKDSLSMPINILKAGYYDTYAENGKYTEISGISVQVIDSSAVKETYLKMEAAIPVRIDKLVFEITAPRYFRRSARLAEMQPVKRSKRRKGTELVTLERFYLQSGKENTLYLSSQPLSDFYIVIDNEDNPPLQVKSIKAYQLNTYLIAQLNKDQSYQLQFGNPAIQAPSYDLSYFQEKIPDTIPLIQVNRIESSAPDAEVRTDSFFTSRAFIWGAIGIIILLLGYMSYRMISEIGKR